VKGTGVASIASASRSASVDS